MVYSTTVLHPDLTQDEILKALLEKAEKRFGKDRAQELRAELEKTAAELAIVHRYPLDFEDEL